MNSCNVSVIKGYQDTPSWPIHSIGQRLANVIFSSVFLWSHVVCKSLSLSASTSTFNSLLLMSSLEAVLCLLLSSKLLFGAEFKRELSLSSISFLSAICCVFANCSQFHSTILNRFTVTLV
jgi:hypothetical protein